MTREEAIEKLNEAIKFAYSEADAEVCRMAISALREQEEKEPCEACHFFADAKVQDFGLYETLVFEFCPLCGRRLEED